MTAAVVMVFWLAGDTLSGANAASSSQEVLAPSAAPNCLLQKFSNSSKLPGPAHLELEQLGASAIPPKPSFPDRPVSRRTDAPASTWHDPTLALRLELHLPVTFLAIHRGPLGPLPEFLESLRTELCTAVSLPASRLSLLSIRGPYGMLQGSMMQKGESVNTSQLAALTDVSLAQSTETRQSYEPEKEYVEQKVLAEANPFDMSAEAAGLLGAHPPPASGVFVDLELEPGILTSDPTPWAFLRLFQEQLRTPESELLTGKFGELLQKSTLMVGAGPDERDPVFSPKSKSAPYHSISLVLAMVCLTRLYLIA